MAKKTTKEVEAVVPKKKGPVWVEYDVTWLFLTSLCGSVPKDPDLIAKWLEAKKPKVRPAGGRSIDEIQEEVFASLADPTDVPVSRLVFQRQDGCLVMRAATVRAHLKDCARVVSAQYVGKIENERSFATKVVNGVYVDEREYWLPILRVNGDRIHEADGTRDKAIHMNVMGRQISALKSFEYVNGARMDFRLKVLGDSVKQGDLETLLIYAGVHGYAGERGDGEGKYTFTITKVPVAE